MPERGGGGGVKQNKVLLASAAFLTGDMVLEEKDAKHFLNRRRRSADEISREKFEECIEECTFLVISCKTTEGINVKKKCQILKVAAKIAR